MHIRRLPVYLLLDCSESMAGETFQTMVAGANKLVSDLKQNPMALETSAMSLITFASRAEQLVPLTPLFNFTLPKLRMGSGTALGEALRILDQAIKREVLTSSPEIKGDYKPLVFIMSDGTPTDDWMGAASQIKNDLCGRKANVIAIGCGPGVDIGALRQITPTVLHISDPRQGSLSGFFRWVSASVSSASVALERGREAAINLSVLPEGTEVPPSTFRPLASDTHLFLHVRCSNSGRFYLLKYEKSQKKAGVFRAQSVYQPVGAYPTDDFDFVGLRAMTTVDSRQIEGALPCPYCSNPLMAFCANGHKLCAPMIHGSVTLTCPWCQTTEEYSFGGGGFNVQSGIG